MLQAELSVVAALMPPDDFDVALLRVWLSLKRSLTDRFVFDGLFSASGLGQPLFCCSTGARSDAVAGLCFTLLYSRVRTPMARLLCSLARCCAHSRVAVLEYPMF